MSGNSKYKGIGLWFNPFFYFLFKLPRLILQKSLTLTSPKNNDEQTKSNSSFG